MSDRPIGLKAMANAIRALSMDAVERAKSGHPGMPMGMADAATVLFARHLKFDAAHPDWPDRDRFVLSAGHGSMLLYSILHLTGHADMTIEELKNFRQLGARTAGHPEYGHALGIETTTGPLGQGIATAVGMALAERMMAARHGADLVDHHTYVIAGDGDLMEGISHEACSLAGHMGLGRLIVLFDDNGITIDGPTSLAVSDDQAKRFEAYGWHVQSVDGHDVDAVDAALTAARKDPRPSLIACRTTIGHGAPTKAGKSSSHGAPLGEKEIAGAREALDWPYPPFEIPAAIRQAWEEVGRRGAPLRDAWTQRLGQLDEASRAAFERQLAGRLPEAAATAIEAFKAKLMEERPSIASRKSSQMALEVLTEAIPELIGGSADLTGSNNTDTKSTPPLDPKDFKGRHIHYGVREHAMVAAMNGIALHGGLIPYGGTFLIFTDYARPAIRLAALMRQRVIVVGTHDSIGLGEDGPTHQPVEQLASLRAMPNLLMLRPADAVETAECWQVALENDSGPSVLALTRQNLPTLRKGPAGENLVRRGAYVIRPCAGERQATILASGSEVAIAVAAAERLEAEGIAAAVVSVPSFELFERQDPAWRKAVLGTAPRVAVEAGSPFGWTRYVESEDHVLGLTSFGASGPYMELYEHFGLTPENVAAKVRSLL